MEAKYTLQELQNEFALNQQELNDKSILMAQDWRETIEARNAWLLEEIAKYKPATRVWTVNEIKNLLETNNTFLARAIVKIYERQTIDEQQTDSTGHNNGIGFNGIDAFILSKFAKFYMDRKFLSPKQITIARKKMMKYAKQLTTIANEAKAQPEQAKPVLVGEVKAGKVYKAANRYTIDNEPDEVIQEQIDMLRGK